MTHHSKNSENFTYVPKFPSCVLRNIKRYVTLFLRCCRTYVTDRHVRINGVLQFLTLR